MLILSLSFLYEVEAPAAIPASRTPIGEVWSNQSEWMVTFDKSVSDLSCMNIHMYMHYSLVIGAKFQPNTV